MLKNEKCVETDYTSTGILKSIANVNGGPLTHITLMFLLPIVDFRMHLKVL